MPAKLAVLALLFALAGCHATNSADPAPVYAQVHAEFLKGHLDRAQQAAANERLQLQRRNPAWSYKFRLLEAEVFSYQGHSQDVVRLLAEGEKSFIPTGDLLIKQETLLSVAYARIGQAQPSAEALDRAKHLSIASNSPLEGEVLRTQGLLEDRHGDQPAAEASYSQSLDLARKEGNAFLEASDLLNLGKAALGAQKVDEALDRFNASTRIAQSIGANVILQTDLGNAGWAFYQLGDFDQALDRFRQAREQARQLGASDNEVLWTATAGLTLYRMGDLQQAQSLYEEALHAASVLHDTARVAEIHTVLGLLFLERNQFEAATTHADAAMQAAQEVGDKPGQLDIAVLRSLLAVRQSTGPATGQTLLATDKAVSASPSQRWAIENALADLYAARHQPARAEQWYRRSIATFEAQRNSVHDEELRLAFFANGDALYRDYADYLIANHRDRQALRLLDDVQARTLEEGLASPTHHEPAHDVDPQQIARTLNATILFYSLGPRASYLWSIDNKETRLTLLPAESEIATHIRSYQASILKSSDPLRDANSDAQWLYATLVSPAETFIHPNTPVIIRLTLASSIRLLDRFAANANPTRPNPGRLLLLGDPITSTPDYAPLTNAASEASNIQQYFPASNRTVLTQAAAIPSAYAASAPEQAAYIHFVAHGTASILLPLDSAILLSPPSDHPDHFKLYARDIVRQPLHAQLVTISACFGSGVRNYKGEGLVGLSWAFLRAGAHHVIGALWEVNDSSTPRLMDELYRGLTAGQPTDEALRRAKLTLVHSAGVYRKPLYWAAFQLYAGS